MIEQNDIIYFMLTDRFCDGDSQNNSSVDKENLYRYHGGDFAGIVKKIPYFTNLGITALWITPVYLNIGNFYGTDSYHGYWALDFEKVDSHLYSHNPELVEGSKEYLKELVNQLHQAGIKVILDVVVNHTGYHNEKYFNYPDKKIKNEWFNQGLAGDEIEGCLAGLPDLDHDQPDVVDYFVNNIVDWIEETRIDGIRMDTVKHVEKKFWYFFKSYVKGKHRNITLIGENLEYNVNNIARYQKDYDFDSLFNFPLCREIKKTFIYNESMTQLARPRLSNDEPQGILDRDACYTNANRLVNLLDNHDLSKRFMTEILDCYGHWDRWLALKIFKLALSFLFTGRGIPQVYYGTEIGLEGYADPDNRRFMPWKKVFGENPDFEPLNQCSEQREIFLHTKQLIKIRKENEALTWGYLFTLYADHFIYAFIREYRGNIVIVVINNGLREMSYPLFIPIAVNGNIPFRIKEKIQSKKLINLLNASDEIKEERGGLSVILGGKTAKIYKLE
ncbi:hypothetical protein KAI68_06525 [bacterium]|nr:hypothetical protein [bacterium]